MDDARTARGASVLDQAARRYRSTYGPPSWSDPCPLPAGLPPVDPFPLEILPEVFRPWISDISERLQCPPDFAAIAAMIALASIVGRKIGIHPKRKDDWLVIANLWGLIIGRPGVLKTPALVAILKVILRLEVQAKTQYELDKADGEARKAVASARKKVAEARIKAAIKNDGDAYEIARMAASADSDAPVRRRYVANDTTVEKLGELLAENPNGLLVFRDELLGLLSALDRDGQEGARQFFLEAWNGNGRFTFDRIGRGTVDIEACCLSILGGIQPGPLQDYLASAPDDGLMQRFQLAVWPDPSPEWKNVDRWPDRNAKEQAWGVFKRMDTLTPLALGAIPSNDGSIPALRFDDKAQAAFSDWRTELERRLRAEEMHPSFEAVLAKHRSLIPSLALLIHLADSPEGQAVPLVPLAKAFAWGEYLESHARRIYSTRLTPSMLGATTLAEKIRSGVLGKEGAFTLRDVYRPAWSRLATIEQAKGAIAVLIDHDWLRVEQEKNLGRPSTRYLVNPKVRDG